YIFNAPDQQNIGIQRHDRYAPPWTHEHEFFEILFVYDGHCDHTISGHQISMRSGDFCIIPPGIRHSVEVLDDTSVCINIFIRKNALQSVFFNFLRSTNLISMFFLNSIYSKNANDYLIFHSGNDHHIWEAVLRCYWEFLNKDEYYYEMIINTLNNAFTMLLRYYSDNVDAPTFMEKADVQRFGLLLFIQENYASVTLDDVAKRFHYSSEYTSRLIKSTTGMTFTQILQKVRIEHAQILLQDTNLPVIQVGIQVGYDTPENFIRTFKKLVHMTPTEYRHSYANI
ncbi:MAG: AraC family transcriptional regulator, partial [Lachnospiraceae bacterium]|nr:AraC family transcriptional regulator [Lachnospiraceae bacterium]